MTCTSVEAQNYLGFKAPKSLREYVNEGLPVVVVGKSKRIGKADLAEFIESHKEIEHE